MWRERAGRLVVALWVVSASSLVVQQVRALREPRPAHPGIPGDDPRGVLDVLEACRRHLGPEDRLGLVYRERGEVVEFLSYRLAYTLYPTLVLSQPYRSGGLEATLADLRRNRATHVLLIGPDPDRVPGAVVVARVGLGRLFRLDPGALQ